MDAPTARGIPLSALCPKFLHTNSTSHINPFGAFAELIDNAYDPDVSAKQIWIEKNIFKQQDCLIFMDNGSGMDYQKMHKMLSFGFSDKKKIRGHAPVGLYGNGFKSGSMRLGKDAIVFSKKGDGMCVGLLSQTYLEETKSENIVVPMVTFTCNRNSQIVASPEHAASLQDILSHSIFQTEKELLCEFDAISNVSQTSLRTGTRIIIWNLRRTLKEESEFDFTSGRYDIQIPVEADQNSSMTHNGQHGRSVPESSFSLRAYCSILYLKPKMQIIIRGEKVQTKLVSKSLAHTMTDKYKPLFLLGKTIPITFGFNPDNKEHYGLMMYHKNRLIKAYERVGCQNKANTKGVGVIGVIECNFLKPTHNKQDFDYTEEYRKTISSVSSKLEDYWKEVCHKRNIEDPNCSVPVEDIMKHPDQSWVQCDECFKWRKLPDGIDARRLPKNWFCHMNPDPQFRSCKVEEEPEDSDEEACNQKTYKHQEQLVKMQKELNKQEALMKQNDSVVSDAGSPVRQTPPSTPSNRMAKITTPSRTPRAFRQSQRSRTRKKARMSIGYQSNLSEGPSTSSMSELCSSRVQSPNLMMDEEEQSGVEGGDLIGSLLRSQRTARPQSENFDCKEISVVGRGEDGQDYKILYQQATRDMEEMRQERDELKSKLDRLEAEKSSAEGNGGSEALRKEPEKDRSDAERLRELRRSVGTLLVKFVPDLKLDQVNFDTSVIEEILNQVLTDISSDDSKDASCNG